MLTKVKQIPWKLSLCEALHAKNNDAIYSDVVQQTTHTGNAVGTINCSIFYYKTRYLAAAPFFGCK